MHLIGNLLSLKTLMRALTVWLISAVLLLILSTALLNCFNAGSKILAYVSSAISLLASFTATMSAVKSMGKSRMMTAIICALSISILLLLIGFVVSDAGLSADGILSVVMFTFSGALLGGFFAPLGTKKVHKSAKKKRSVKS